MLPMNSNWPLSTNFFTTSLVSLVWSFHHRQKNAVSTWIYLEDRTKFSIESFHPNISKGRFILMENRPSNLLFLGVFLQCLYNGFDSVSDSRPLSSLVGPEIKKWTLYNLLRQEKIETSWPQKVLVDCFEPSRVIVRVRDDVDIQDLFVICQGWAEAGRVTGYYLLTCLPFPCNWTVFILVHIGKLLEVTW